jgi:methylmalonyl-CoA mutase C-terminal domain/subunit
MNRPVRVLVAKPGLDGHDRGAKVVARALRDAGFEVIYTGLHQTPAMVVRAALQEDVDVVGLSIHSGAHLPLVEAIQKQMKKEKLEKPIFVGGIIPDEDSAELKKWGVAAVFGPGSSLASICDSVAKLAKNESAKTGLGKSKRPALAKRGPSKKTPTKKTDKASNKTLNKNLSKAKKKTAKSSLAANLKKKNIPKKTKSAQRAK